MMNSLPAFSIVACGFVTLLACSSTSGSAPAIDAASTSTPDSGAGTSSDAAEASTSSDAAEPTSSDAAGTLPDGGMASAETVLDLDDLTANPTPYDWFDFRPNIKKLILAGVPESEHVAILWYTTADGGVALHYHAKTESVYVIDGTQTDAKGVYPTGTVYFNPPGSGHEITHSTGFFILAYAAPPDFASTSLIGEYTPVRIDTGAPDLTSLYPFEESHPGMRVFAPPLDAAGGMSATLVETTSSEDHVYQGNYLLVLEGSCDIDGVTYPRHRLVVGKTVEPRPYKLAASKDSTCRALGVSF